MNKILIPEGQIHSGNEVNERSYYQIPIGDKFYPWHQGRKTVEFDNYAEYVPVEDTWSEFETNATRIHIELRTVKTNQRRHHGWKGYDYIEGVTTTSIYFNNTCVYELSTRHDLLKHLVKVERIVEELQSIGIFGWWSKQDIENVIGRDIEYKGLKGKIDSLILDQGCMIIYIPDWRDDDYWTDGKIKTDILDKNINYYPSTEN